MKDAFIKKSLKRIYEECDKAEERKLYTASYGIYEKFNTVLKMCKYLHKDNEIVMSVKDFDSGLMSDYSNGALQAIKQRTLTLMDALGIDAGELNQISSPQTVINFSQNQSQLSVQNVSSAIEIVNKLNIDSDQKEVLVANIKEFEKETSKPKPDESKLRKILEKIGEVSKDAALVLFGYALNKGFLGF